MRASVETNTEFSTLLVSLPFTDDAQVKKVSDTITVLLMEKQHIQQPSQIIGSSLNGPSVS